jgi:site-specific recombinase XerD
MPKKISSHHTYRGDAMQPLLPGSLLTEDPNRQSPKSIFEEYRSRRSEHTLRRQEADLLLFREFITLSGVKTLNLCLEPAAWRVITWALVENFVKWQLSKGYAIPSINVRLSTIKTYARLSVQAGTLTPQEYALIREVQGYTSIEQVHIDQRRPIHRIGYKKAEPIKINAEQANALKNQPDTPQGRRDTLMMNLLLDHGLKVGELAELKMSDFDLSDGKSRFCCKDQWQKLSPGTLAALQACLSAGELDSSSYLLRRSKKNEELGEAGMSDRAITGRVCALGEKIGIKNLSSHDCRYYWANSIERQGSDILELN